MRKVKLFTDSTSDLTPELRSRYDIQVVPLYVVFGEKAYRDGIDITPSELYRMVGENGNLPKTAAPSPGDFATAFEPFIEADYDILYIGLSSEISSTVQSAHIAAEQFPEGRIAVVDSLNLCTGIGLQVILAARLLDEGKSMPEVVEILLRKRKDVEAAFVIDTLDYLHMGGRCSSTQAFIGNILKIRPIVTVADGKMSMTARIRGKREKALRQLVDNALVHANQMVPSLVFVAHSFAKDEAEFIKGELLAHPAIEEVYITEAGCVISSHCGPQTAGLFYLRQ